jgi:hypothetical protein
MNDIYRSRLLNISYHIAKIEDPDLSIPRVDTIISEPIGVLLFHERMVIHDIE